VLSPFLFNFFINDLITNCINTKCGANIHDCEVGIIAYCDDIVVMSPTGSGLIKMLEECHKYAQEWKLEFNASKSAYLEFGKYNNNFTIKLGEKNIPKTKSIDYLGLPLGNEIDKVNYVEKKMQKVERSFYSLHSFGCKKNALSPYTIAYVYKQYCQSIFKYGLELIEMSKRTLKELDTRQSILIKRSVGLSKYAKTKPLINCLRVESIQQLYYKNKIFFVKQILKNELTFNIFNFLNEYYKNSSNKNSFVKQVSDVNYITGVENCLINLNETIRIIENLFKIENLGLLNSIQFIIDFFFINRNYIDMYKSLNILLNYENYNANMYLDSQCNDVNI